jgi:octaprenyl-diphosphate synthase
MFTGWDEYHLINRELSNLIASLPKSDLGEVIGYILSAPGKRVRPLILIFSAQAFGCTGNCAVNAALAVELAHAASLVHDDILDSGMERRGAPSALDRFGSDAAILAGDYLISKSIEMISSYSPAVIGAFAKACMIMSEGEMLDLSSASSDREYYSCISQKTASLFAASAQIGGLIACAPSEEVAKLERYGTHLGLAYQVLDDLEEHLCIYQGKEAVRKMCVEAISGHCSEAKAALTDSNGDDRMKEKLEELVDRMTEQGLEQCRSLRSQC